MVIFNSYVKLPEGNHESWGQIRPGQAILEVNGTTETMAMLQEFKDASRVEVRFKNKTGGT